MLAIFALENALYTDKLLNVNLRCCLPWNINSFMKQTVTWALIFHSKSLSSDNTEFITLVNAQHFLCISFMASFIAIMFCPLCMLTFDSVMHVFDWLYVLLRILYLWFTGKFVPHYCLIIMLLYLQLRNCQPGVHPVLASCGVCTWLT